MSHESSVISKDMQEYGYKKLTVWQKSIELALMVYALTKQFPKEEQFGLTSQLRRSVVSIASNIAEGSGRRTKKDFRQFLSIAYGSAMEVETQLLLSKRLLYGESKDYEHLEKLLSEVIRMLNKMVLNRDDD